MGAPNVTALTAAQRDLLIRMLQAERQQQQRLGERDSFVLVRRSGGHDILTTGWDESWTVPAEQDVDDLVEDGFLRHVDHAGGRGRKFDFTRAGRTRARQLERDRTDPARPEPIDLSWMTTLALLEALVDAYELAGAPEHGVPLTALGISSPPTEGEQRELVRQELASSVFSATRPTADYVLLREASVSRAAGQRPRRSLTRSRSPSSAKPKPPLTAKPGAASGRQP